MRLILTNLTCPADLSEQVQISVTGPAGNNYISATLPLTPGLNTRLSTIEKLARAAAAVSGLPARSLHIRVIIYVYAAVTK